MAINYARIFNRRVTSQSQPIPGSNQVRNSGGGYSWQVDDWTRLDRFLILAKAVVVGMTSNGFTLADPNDRGLLDVVGFDTSAPAIITDFFRDG